jgi:hypothetical protein
MTGLSMEKWSGKERNIPAPHAGNESKDSCLIIITFMIIIIIFIVIILCLDSAYV